MISPAARRKRDERWLVGQLPVAMQQEDFFVRFVSIFQDIATSYLEACDGIEHTADASVAPEPLLPWLASWIGAEPPDPALPDAVQRLVVRTHAATLAWRGTRTGLRRFLERMTGGPAEVVDGGGVWRERSAPGDGAWVRMTVASTGWLPEEQFVALVADEVPAHVAAELRIGDRVAWTSNGDPSRTAAAPHGQVGASR